MHKYVEILENCELENERYCVAGNKYFFSRIHLNLGKLEEITQWY